MESDKLIKEDDDGLRKAWQRRGQPFEHHKYMISESVGYAEGDVDDGYELSFDELCNACYEWRFSDYCEVARHRYPKSSCHGEKAGKTYYRIYVNDDFVKELNFKPCDMALINAVAPGLDWKKIDY